MNTKGNKRNQQSREAIRNAYLTLVQARTDASSITVSDICKKAGVNRSTFYAHYLDMSDLNRETEARMQEEYLKVFGEEAAQRIHSFDFLKLFRFVQKRQDFCLVYFKLGYDFIPKLLEKGFEADFAVPYRKDMDHRDYHVAFFTAGITAIVKKWFQGGFVESPEELARILSDEYRKRTDIAHAAQRTP